LAGVVELSELGVLDVLGVVVDVLDESDGLDIVEGLVDWVGSVLVDCA
jgi:hypothetical protein